VVEKRTLTVAEALKELKLIKTKIERNCTDLNKYSSRIAEMPELIEGQAAYVKNLRKSTEDLMSNFINIRCAIMTSNLETTVEVAGRTYTITELLFWKQKTNQGGLRDHYEMFIQSFNDRTAETQKAEYRRYATKTEDGDVKQPTVILHYKEKELRELRDKHTEFLLKVDAAIDAANHSTTISV